MIWGLAQGPISLEIRGLGDPYHYGCGAGGPKSMGGLYHYYTSINSDPISGGKLICKGGGKSTPWHPTEPNPALYLYYSDHMTKMYMVCVCTCDYVSTCIYHAWVLCMLFSYHNFVLLSALLYLHIRKPGLNSKMSRCRDLAILMTDNKLKQKTDKTERSPSMTLWVFWNVTIMCMVTNNFATYTPNTACPL